MNHLDKTTEKCDQQLLLAVAGIAPNAAGTSHSFSQQLDALLKQKHFRNKKLADRAGISPNLIAQYRRGKASCSPSRAGQLAKILDCTEAQRIALCRAAALTTRDPIGESVQAMLLERGIDQDSIISVVPSATDNQLSIATVDGAVVTLTISIVER